MRPGRRTIADPGVLYSFAHVFYWEWKTLAEGAHRWYVNKPQLERLKLEVDSFRLTPEDQARLDQCVSEEIREGRLADKDRTQRMQELENDLLFDLRFAGENAARELSSTTVPIPGEPEVINLLLNATTSEEVVEICSDAFSVFSFKNEAGEESERRVQNWPVARLPLYLSEHAADFIEAKNDSRYPKSTRPSTRLKQFWFLSRALAGAEYGVTTRTAINLVGSMHPDMMFQQSRDGKPARKQRKSKKTTKRDR